MADTEESPAQRQARLRREKRESKIKSAGQERLDKITKLSGRAPESMKNYDSPIQTPPRTASPAALPPPSPPSPPIQTPDPAQLRQQEEFLRAMLRNQGPQQQQQSGQNAEAEDPMIKMIQSMLGGMNGDPSAPGGGLPSLNPDDIAKATGLPSFLTNMVMGKQETAASPGQVRDARIWKLLHILIAVVTGIYMLFTVDNLTSTFGENPPAPATVQNPFVIFIMAELLLHGVRPFITSTPSKGGVGFWFQTAKEVGRDGAVMVFLMGAYNWWHGLA